MNEQQMQQAFIEFLAQKYQLKSEQELEAKIQELGEKGLKAEYAEFQKLISEQQSRKMMFGAKLNYIKSLRGQCPVGTELRYYKVGGKVCAKCEQLNRQQYMYQDPIEAFKCGRKMKKKQTGGLITSGMQAGTMGTMGTGIKKATDQFIQRKKNLNKSVNNSTNKIKKSKSSIIDGDSTYNKKQNKWNPINFRK